MNFNLSELDYSLYYFLKGRSLYLRHWLQIKLNRSQWRIQTFRGRSRGGGVRSSRSWNKGGGAGLPQKTFRPFGPLFGLKVRPRSAIGSSHISYVYYSTASLREMFSHVTREIVGLCPFCISYDFCSSKLVNIRVVYYWKPHTDSYSLITSGFAQFYWSTKFWMSFKRQLWRCSTRTWSK